jgi:hypothetical protein
MLKENIHIGVIIPDNFPDQMIDLLKSDIDSLNIDIRKVPFGGPYNSMEWAVPTAIVVFILKAYFDSLLKEAGKNHYEVLKRWLKKTANQTRSVKVTNIYAPQSSDKADSTNTQSRVFSIEIRTTDGYQIKFLFDTELSEEDWNKAIDNALILVEKKFASEPVDELSIEIQTNQLDKTIYARINKETKKWEFLDYKKIYEEKFRR